ncbi:MAG: hypothetical protein E7266_00735 [Lachnospiraceae bacterium]|nr:hypothetical protein [Lachnospiraceae bacterium]
MESNPKIVILQLKEIITVLLVILAAILLLVLFLYIFLPKNDDKNTEQAYNPGTYTSSVDIGATTLEVVVSVDSNHIKDISIKNLSEAVTTIYPLLKTSLDDISRQVIETQSTENIYCGEDNLYTSTVILTGINCALDKAKLP